jgi:hypothetical protein
MKTLTASLIAALALAGGLIAPSLAPCATEDQTTPCYWDAGTRSNGKGSSFIITITGDTLTFR